MAQLSKRTLLVAPHTVIGLVGMVLTNLLVRKARK